MSTWTKPTRPGVKIKLGDVVHQISSSIGGGIMGRAARTEYQTMTSMELQGNEYLIDLKLEPLARLLLVLHGWEESPETIPTEKPNDQRP